MPRAKPETERGAVRHATHRKSEFALCGATHCAGYQENARDMAFCERTTAVNDAAMLPR